MNISWSKINSTHKHGVVSSQIVTGAGTFTARLLVVAPEDHAARYAAALGDRIPLQDSVTHSEEWRVDGVVHISHPVWGATEMSPS